MLSSRSARAARLVRALQGAALGGERGAASDPELLAALLRAAALSHHCFHAAATAAVERRATADGGATLDGASSSLLAARLHWHAATAPSSTLASSSPSSTRLGGSRCAGGGSGVAAAAAAAGPGAGEQPAAEPGHTEAEGSATPLLTVNQMLAVGGPQAQEAAAALEFLRTRGRLSEGEARSVVQRIAEQAPPQGKCAPMRQPRMFSFEKEVLPVAEYLMALPGLDLRRCLKQSPHILVGTTVARMEHNRRRLAERLQLQPEELASIAAKYPFILREDLDRRIFPIFDFQAGLGFSVAQQRGIALRFPASLAHSLSRMQMTVAWLRRLGLTDAHLRSALWKLWPLAVIRIATAQLWLDWIRSHGVEEDKLPGVVARFPMVLGYSQEKRDAFVRLLLHELRLPPDTVGRVLVRVPDTLGRSVELLRRNWETMRSEVGLDDDQLRKLVHSNPGLLRLDLSSPTYAAKLRFARQELQVEDLGGMLLTHPFYLNYRLARIAARGCYLRSLDQPRSNVTPWLAHSEELFCEKFAKQPRAHYHEWLAGWQESEAGRQWLGQAAARTSRMSALRLDLEQQADAAEAAAAAEALAGEAAAAGEEAQRLRGAERLLREQLGPEFEAARDVATRALAEVSAARAASAEERASAALRLVRERLAAAGAKPAATG